MMEYADEFFSFLTGKASAALARRLHRNFREHGLDITSEQWSILYYLWIEEGRTQQELACLTFRDKPSISRLINNLEKVKLVMRVHDDEDKRANLIFLTKQGRQIREVCMRQARRTIAQALEGVNYEDMIRAKKTLEVVYENLK